MEEKQQVLLVKEGTYWANLQALAQNAVVQVFSQVAEFNWREPYKVEAQYENRGSGFFINDQGYFITNAHVINEAKRIWIHIPAMGRQPLHAHVVGMCPDRDLALLCLDDDAQELIQKKFGGTSFFGLGDSDQILRTESVLTLGYPLGQYRLKSTTGVVSGRESLNSHSLIQITAPINPGSSGGPLLNVNGEVVGIAIASIEQAQNVGYAIPINELKMVLEDLNEKKLVRKPYLGVRFSYSGDEKARFLNNPLPSGLYISMVLKNSLFDQAGVKEGDMLYEFNGYSVDGYGEASVPWSLDKTPLHDLVSRIEQGQMIKMVVYRNGNRMDIEFEFTLTQEYPIRRLYPGYETIEYEVIAGLVIMPLADNHLPLLLDMAPDLITYRLPENKIDSVLIITHVLTGSYAHQMRTLQPGFVVRQVNGTQVGTLDDFRKALQKSIATGFLTVKTDRDEFTAFSLERLLADEERLSHDFVYPLSKTVQKLYRAVKKG